MEIYAYDFDGVVSIGIKPMNVDDLIITGRCQEEAEYVLSVLKKNGIENHVVFNQMLLSDRGTNTIDSRIYSGKHKAKSIEHLFAEGVIVKRFFDDDPVQIEIMRNFHPEIEYVQINSTLVNY